MMVSLLGFRLMAHPTMHPLHASIQAVSQGRAALPFPTSTKTSKM